jgi:hypothetical protein
MTRVRIGRALGVAAALCGLLTGRPAATDATPPADPTGILDGATGLFYADVARLRAHASEQPTALGVWKGRVLQGFTNDFAVDMATLADLAFVTYPEGTIAVFRFPADVDRKAVFARIGTDPQPRGDDVFHLDDVGPYVLFQGPRTVVISPSEELIRRYHGAMPELIAPAILRDSRGSGRNGELFAEYHRPLPEMIRSGLAYQLGADAGSIARVARVRFTADLSDDVPIRLEITADDDTVRRLAELAADVVKPLAAAYESLHRARLIADIDAPATPLIIGDLDRMVRGLAVAQTGPSVMISVPARGGLPRLVDLYVNEIARVSVRAQRTFGEIVEELKRDEESTDDGESQEAPPEAEAAR